MVINFARKVFPVNGGIIMFQFLVAIDPASKSLPLLKVDTSETCMSGFQIVVCIRYLVE